MTSALALQATKMTRRLHIMRPGLATQPSLRQRLPNDAPTHCTLQLNCSQSGSLAA